MTLSVDERTTMRRSTTKRKIRLCPEYPNIKAEEAAKDAYEAVMISDLEFGNVNYKEGCRYRGQQDRDMVQAV